MYSGLEVHGSEVPPKCYHTATKSRSHGLAGERRKETGPPSRDCPCFYPFWPPMEVFKVGSLPCSLGSPSALWVAWGNMLRTCLFTSHSFSSPFLMPHMCLSLQPLSTHVHARASTRVRTHTHTHFEVSKAEVCRPFWQRNN